MKDFRDLIRSGNKNNKKNTFSKEKIINKAIQLHIKGNISEASNYYKKIINEGCNNPTIFSNYGTILAGLGESQEAEKYFRKTIELNPKDALAHNNLGNLLRDLNKLKEAELSILNAIELNPHLAGAHNNLGNIMKELGKLNKAELSYRKAIELEPDFADFHNSLASVLINLGKLKELLLLSKLTLKLKSINQEYKLLTLLRITIAHLLQKNFSKTLLFLEKINYLKNQESTNSFESEKNKKYFFTFSNFITSLYPLLDKENKNSPTKIIPHFGESHCLSFAHQTLSISSQLRQIQPVLVTGGKAWHFANMKNNEWKDSLTQQIKYHTYSEKAFISFGEIDCRRDEGILNYAIKNDKDISEICEETIKGYMKYMEQILSKYYSERYYFGVPAPTIKKELLDDLDIKRIEIIKLYNSILKKEVLSKGSYFLDIYKLTSNNLGLNNNIYMCDSVHLSPKCLSILFKNFLYKS